MKPRVTDITIIGSGFAGSILAHGLTSIGYQVAIIEQGSHPRFAIGESSTPLADLSLRRISEEYDLPWLEPLSRFGSWRRTYPNLLCGRKRGFSYYFHGQDHDPFEDAFLVAASSDDEHSDTQWYRADVDHFLVRKLQERGVLYRDHTTVTALYRDPKTKLWHLELSSNGTSHPDGTGHDLADRNIIEYDGADREVSERNHVLTSWFIIDATGGTGFSSSHLNSDFTQEGFLTKSAAVYSHLNLPKTWTSVLESRNRNMDHYPFHADYAALHHLIDEGWMWMLRFENNRVSTGVVLDVHDKEVELRWMKQKAEWESSFQGEKPSSECTPEIWTYLLNRYPSLGELFQDAKPVPDLPSPWMFSPLLQRRSTRMSGLGWMQTHHTAGFVDPLHSTGLAFTLSGVEKTLSLFRRLYEKADDTRFSDSSGSSPLKSRYMGSLIEGEWFEEQVQRITDGFHLELSHIDRVVAASYHARHSPELFKVATMLYFISTIHHEQALLNKNTSSETLFLRTDDPGLRAFVEEATQAIIKERIRFLAEGFSQIEEYQLCQRLIMKMKSMDPVGLFEPSDPGQRDPETGRIASGWRAKSFIAHSAVDLT